MGENDTYLKAMNSLYEESDYHIVEGDKAWPFWASMLRKFLQIPILDFNYKDTINRQVKKEV